jgi:hypothetical protein
MSETNKPLVFVSYSHDDTDYVLKLLADLDKKHVPYWFDKLIPTGQHWDRFVQQKLKQATHLLFVMSESALNSENVLDEVTFCIDHGVKTEIVPIRIDNCTPFFRTARYQHIDFHTLGYESGLKNLYKVLPQVKQQPDKPVKKLSDTQRTYYQFWEILLDRARKRTTLHIRNKPNKNSSVAATAGVSGLQLRYHLHHRDASVQLYIDTGDKARNKTIFDELHTAKAAIEKAAEKSLQWDRLENNRASRIVLKLPGNINYRDEDNWPDVQDTLIDAMIAFEAAFRPHLDALNTAD